VLARHLVEQDGELRVRFGIGELARLVVERVAELNPESLVDRHRGELRDVLRLLVPELLVALGLAGDTDDGEFARQEAVGLEVVEGR